MADRPELNAEEILRRLSERGVDYVVIGGVAAALHGSARDTYDLDICFATDAGNLEALGDVLVGLGARLRGVDEDVPFVPDAATLRKVELLCLATTEGDFDVLGRPTGAPAYETLRRRANRYDIGGLSVLVAAIDDLIAMKQAAGRGKDIDDVETLETIKRLTRRRPERD
jgi:predicted nucleotidyltransferase